MASHHIPVSPHGGLDDAIDDEVLDIPVRQRSGDSRSGDARAGDTRAGDTRAGDARASAARASQFDADQLMREHNVPPAKLDSAKSRIFKSKPEPPADAPEPITSHTIVIAVMIIVIIILLCIVAYLVLQRGKSSGLRDAVSPIRRDEPIGGSGLHGGHGGHGTRDGARDPRDGHGSRDPRDGARDVHGGRDPREGASNAPNASSTPGASGSSAPSQSSAPSARDQASKRRKPKPEVITATEAEIDEAIALLDKTKGKKATEPPAVSPAQIEVMEMTEFGDALPEDAELYSSVQAKLDAHE
jgi:hypothetical protein